MHDTRQTYPIWDMTVLYSQWSGSKLETGWRNRTTAWGMTKYNPTLLHCAVKRTIMTSYIYKWFFFFLSRKTHFSRQSGLQYRHLSIEWNWSIILLLCHFSFFFLIFLISHWHVVDNNRSKNYQVNKNIS